MIMVSGIQLTVATGSDVDLTLSQKLVCRLDLPLNGIPGITLNAWTRTDSLWTSEVRKRGKLCSREQLYALKTWDKPPTIETYRVHPFMKQANGDSSTDNEPEPKGLDAIQRGPGQGTAEATSRRFGQISADPRSAL